MQDDPKSAEFDIEEARRVLGEVFAPWVRDLGLSIDGIDCVPPEPAPPLGISFAPAARTMLWPRPSGPRAVIALSPAVLVILPVARIARSSAA